mmetsp:Transcript_13715/g.27555  ORF Transcript_13715/g.27555 Transcript_13715/m.27555 type:complete len:201 (+) Transcript_13715:100-702(+)
MTALQQQDDAPVLQAESDGPFDLMPVRKPDPFEALRHLNWDLCRHAAGPAQSPPPPRMRSATVDTNMSPLSHTDSKNGLDQVLQNAKAVFDDFWQQQLPSNKIPTEIAAKDVLETNNNKELQVSTSTIHDVADKFEEEEKEEEENEVILSVIVTEPGTSRASRIYRGLELFAVAVCVVGLTMYLITQSDVELAFVLESKK